ncbi:MAG: radical SAM protein [Treponema sp.]|jgi:oxygen-independent coproporphyrinogen-3 oxidase|nr:radical SAM protein [Treponema sp.]
MFQERLRSHHDAERKLAELLGRMPPGPAAITGRGHSETGAAPLDQNLRLEARLNEKPDGKKAALYVHVPYCDHTCSFCNLNRKERQGVDLDAYADQVVSEMKTWGAFPYVRKLKLEAVYFGGGTPTALTARQFANIFKTIKDSFTLSEDCEITVESTLHNLGADKAAALESCGVNRLSIGIQTFSDRGRKLLGRFFTGVKAEKELAALRNAFGGILGIDVIYSYPGQTLPELRRDADLCIASGIDSVSFYPLMIQPKSALAAAIEQGKIAFTRDIAVEIELHNLFYHALKNAGFDLLELSKLVRPASDRYRYIQFQYGAGDIIPAGSGAGGKIAGFSVYSTGGRRMVSAPAPRYDSCHRILGRLQFGLYDPALIAGIAGPEKLAAITDAMTSLEREGLLELQAGKSTWKPTVDGVFWGNNMAVKIIEAAITAHEAVWRK